MSDRIWEVTLELLALAGLRGTCEPDSLGDDDLTLVVDGVTFETELARTEPVPDVIECVNAVLRAHRLDRRLLELREPTWDGGELGVVLANKQQRDDLCEEDLLEGYAYDPEDPLD